MDTGDDRRPPPLLSPTLLLQDLLPPTVTHRLHHSAPLHPSHYTIHTTLHTSHSHPLTHHQCNSHAIL